MKRILTIALLLLGASLTAQTGAETFWSNLQKHCGKA